MNYEYCVISDTCVSGVGVDPCTREFREQAARLVIETGQPVNQVGAEIGVGEQLLWRRGSLLICAMTGQTVSCKTVTASLRHQGLARISPRTFTPATTVINPDASAPDDLVKRRFDVGAGQVVAHEGAGSVGLVRLVSDIT